MGKECAMVASSLFCVWLLLDWVLSDLCANPTGQGSNEPLGRNLPLRLIA